MAGVAGRSGGRNAKTVQEHQQRGTYRNDHHGGSTNPDPERGAPEPPKPIEGEVRAEWDRMLVRLKDMGTLSVVDGAALYQYCSLFAETEALAVSKLETAASIDLLEENLRGIDKDDLVACFHEITKLRQLESRYGVQIRQGRMAIRSYLVEFGLTPAARSRVKIAKPDAPTSKWDGLVN